MLEIECFRKLEVPEVKWEKLHYKPWRKLIARLVKTFNLPPDTSPCLNKKRNEGALQFLLHKRFVENSFGDESWKEMVQEAVRDDEMLQKELVAQVAIYGSNDEALMWANHFGISKEHLPYNIRMLSESKSEGVDKETEKENWDLVTQKVETFHKYPLPNSTIHLLSTESDFQEFLSSGLTVSD